MTVLAKLVTVYTNDKKKCLCLAFTCFSYLNLVAYYLNVRLRVYNRLREFGSLIWHYNLQSYDFCIRPGLFCHFVLFRRRNKF